MAKFIKLHAYRQPCLVNVDHILSIDSVNPEQARDGHLSIVRFATSYPRSAAEIELGIPGVYTLAFEEPLETIHDMLID